MVFSMDYRWGGKADGDAIGNTMANLIEDVFGGSRTSWSTRRSTAATRRGLASPATAPADISGGGSLMTNIWIARVRQDSGYLRVHAELPAEGKTASRFATNHEGDQGRGPSYGVFSPALLNTYSEEHKNDQAWKEAIAPISHIPPATERSVPQFLTRGTRDPDPGRRGQGVRRYLVKAGQRAEYIQVGGAGHAFFDWKPDENTQATSRIRRVLRGGDEGVLRVSSLLTPAHGSAVQEIYWSA